MEVRRIELLSITPATCGSTPIADLFKIRCDVAPTDKANTRQLTYKSLVDASGGNINRSSMI